MTSSALPLRRMAVRLPAAWRRLGRRECAYAAALGVAGGVYFILLDVPSEVFHESLGFNMTRYLANALFAYEVLAFSMLLALVLADDAVDRGAPRTRTYAAAIVAGCLVGTLVGTLCEAAFWTWWTDLLGRRGWSDVVRAVRRTVLRDSARWLPLCLGLGFLYAEMRRVRRTQAQLRAAELARAHRTRAAHEARLSAMQARVEPQFLFDTLGRIRDLYEVAAHRADAVLDDLIAYLRAAMPKMREASSTVREECELARTYLAIVAPGAQAAQASRIVAPDEVADAHFPPMVLLPLIDCALEESGRDAPELRIHVMRDGAVLRANVAVLGSAFARGAADARIRALRDRLAALFGPAGRLALRRRDAAWTEAVVELPYERAGATEEAAAT
jgi:hypothetical protein